MSHTYVLDFQGFKDNNNNFIIKEIAVTDINNSLLLHWFIQQPYSISKLSPAYMRQANYNSKFYHGIPWNYGNTSFKHVKKELNKILAYNYVLIKGKEKQIFIQHLFKKAYVEDLDYIPSLKKLKSKYFYNSCPFHQCHVPLFSCALENVLKIQTYLQLTKL